MYLALPPPPSPSQISSHTTNNVSNQSKVIAAVENELGRFQSLKNSITSTGKELQSSMNLPTSHYISRGERNSVFCNIQDYDNMTMGLIKCGQTLLNELYRLNNGYVEMARRLKDMSEELEELNLFRNTFMWYSKKYDDMSTMYALLQDKHTELKIELAKLAEKTKDYDQINEAHTQLWDEHANLKIKFAELKGRTMNYNQICAAHTQLQNKYTTLEANFVALKENTKDYDQLRLDFEAHKKAKANSKLMRILAVLFDRDDSGFEYEAATRNRDTNTIEEGPVLEAGPVVETEPVVGMESVSAPVANTEPVQTEPEVKAEFALIMIPALLLLSVSLVSLLVFVITRTHLLLPFIAMASIMSVSFS
ncbi:hypothetical protein BC937DRAFT_91642 [Endogone sp. FLAS-F59071]|nr:hypothetical protein BC937DRAFT_91642 [Endogone sp. FLAS-F59071]|eukprot:RUS16063.1 hypothetical protein BC937DRAFT_91642 [Endogone sp. FLAS-F59071]